MIFDRKTRAFYAYEQRMMLPRTWPPTKHDVPALWERAKTMFAATLKTIGSAARLAQRYRFRNADARALNAMLRPVEKIVRTLLMIEAATFLLMTPEGARMRREAKLITPPSPPAPPAPPSPPHSTRILMPGWHTIAALHPRIDPRVVEREERERREALEHAMHALEIEADLPGEGVHDTLDPETWRVRFPVLHWVHAEQERTPTRKPHILCAVLGDDSHFPLTHDIIPRAPQREEASPDADPNALAFARRIEALSRVLADPRVAIRQVARRLAAIPADHIAEPNMDRAATHLWRHGKPEAWNATLLAQPAIRALVSARHAAAPPPEPG